ncbi:MAG: hypothetical protein HRT83_01200 [Hyphomicrobiaceae bacterium]|nr:hypothetical protein [Hyphomicrobiaceae bacterium]
MQITWRNGMFDLEKNCDTWTISLFWNNISLLSDQLSSEDNQQYADKVKISWRWPEFRGFGLWQHHLKWNGL